MLLKVNSHRLNAELIEGPARLNFVCIHGLADTLQVWSKVSAGLAQLGRVALIDLRAHGASDAPAGACSREDLAADVTGAMDALRLERAVLVGHSAGGIVAMAAALKFPERAAGLVLIGTAARCNERTARFYESIAEAAERGGLEGAAKVIFGTAERRIAGDAPGFAAVTRMLKSLYTDPLLGRLGAIRCPVMLMVGEKDPMGPSASSAIQREVIQAKLHVLPGRGHWIHREAPEQFLGLVTEFVAANFA